MKTEANHVSKDYLLSKFDLLDIDILNSSKWLVSETLPEVLVSYGSVDAANSSSRQSKKSILYDNFTILTSVHEYLHFDILLDYFYEEDIFIATNLKAATISYETGNKILKDSVLNIINLPFDEYTYLLKEELSFLPEFAIILSVSRNTKSLPNIIMQYPSLGFTDEVLIKYEETSFMIIQYWINLVQTLPIEGGFAQLDLSNLSGLSSHDKVKKLIDEIPFKYREFVSY